MGLPMQSYLSDSFCLSSLKFFFLLAWKKGQSVCTCTGVDAFCLNVFRPLFLDLVFSDLEMKFIEDLSKEKKEQRFVVVDIAFLFLFSWYGYWAITTYMQSLYDFNIR